MQELFHAVNEQMVAESRVLQERIISFDQACQKIQIIREGGGKAVFTSGVFDILHTAHLHYLMHLKMRGDVLIVGIDDNVGSRRIKGDEHPFFDEHERAMVIANIRCVDYVFVFGGLWRAEDIAKLNPNFVGIPSFDPNMENKLEKLRIANILPIITPPYLKSQSSSRKARIVQSDYLFSNIVSDKFYE